MEALIETVTHFAPKLVISAAITLLAFGLWKVMVVLRRRRISAMRLIPGPPSTHWFYRNGEEILAAENADPFEAWEAQYGQTFVYHFALNEPHLCTSDMRAINHVLTHSYTYQKPRQIRNTLSRVTGYGLLCVEEDQHKQQRKIINPAFGTAQTRALTDIMTAKANQLRDVWASDIEKKDYTGRTDVMWGLSAMTLDVIGQAGFGYDFDALSPEGSPNELNDAFTAMFKAAQQLNLLSVLSAFLPIFRKIPSSRRRRITAAQRTMQRIGRGLLAESKAAVVGHEKDTEASRGRDLLSLLVRANTAKDLPESQRMSDADVLAQVPTFLIAGHETSSTATTWALYALTQNPSAQKKLREELLSVPTDTPTMDQLSDLHYLDAVVREALRMYAPVPNSVRVAMKDDIIPLDTPFVDKNGVTQHSIKITKGDWIFIPISLINRSEKIWGDDAKEFKPERWEATPDGAQKIPGVWGNQLTFLGGPHACVGYKFSIIQIKALLFALIRAFEFELAVPAEDVKSKQLVVRRPWVKSEPDGGIQMPLIIKPYQL